MCMKRFIENKKKKLQSCQVVLSGFVSQKKLRMAAFNIHELLINTSFLSTCLNKYLDDFFFSFFREFFAVLFLLRKENRQKAYSKAVINLKKGNIRLQIWN